MKSSRTVFALVAIAAGLLSWPVLGDENPPTQIAQAAPPAATSPASATPAAAEPVAVTAAATTPAQAAPAAEPVKAPEAKVAASTTTPGPAAPAAGSPFQIKIGDAMVRFGLMLQPQLDFQENTAGNTGQNFLVRRARFLVGGQVSKTVFFFFETENSRLGNSNAQGTKTMNTGFQTLDAVAEWRVNKKFNISGGLLRVPTSRDALESASNEFTLDFNTYAFTATTALAGTGGRDTGAMVRGYFLKDKLEYRAAVVSGLRGTGARNTMRTVGRVQYNFFDTEVYGFPSYAGSNFGKKKILALGAAYDTQEDYDGFTTDLFADIPTRFGSAIGTATFQRLDAPVTMVAALAKSDIATLDGGLYFKKSKIGPWARWEQREFDASGRTESRYMVGLNYYPLGNNFNIKAGYGRFTPAVGREMGQFCIQLQAYYY
jgi:hypothetical protein